MSTVIHYILLMQARRGLAKSIQKASRFSGHILNMLSCLDILKRVLSLLQSFRMGPPGPFVKRLVAAIAVVAFAAVAFEKGDEGFLFTGELFEFVRVVLI
jgi:hypothetical protein